MAGRAAARMWVGVGGHSRTLVMPRACRAPPGVVPGGGLVLALFRERQATSRARRRASGGVLGWWARARAFPREASHLASTPRLARTCARVVCSRSRYCARGRPPRERAVPRQLSCSGGVLTFAVLREREATSRARRATSAVVLGWCAHARVFSRERSHLASAPRTALTSARLACPRSPYCARGSPPRERATPPARSLTTAPGRRSRPVGRDLSASARDGDARAERRCATRAADR